MLPEKRLFKFSILYLFALFAVLVADRMMAHGLTMPQVQLAVRETVAYARETVGAEPVNLLVRSVPGLTHVV